MPPLRNFLPVAPVKTERTHEENQERAYIAASRRGDRSLEARVESARRASEIHKRRTGRSLRVTEQDVLNEEMYEEEDDDLPSQYRRLTAHLQTGSADFNRRLAAYLTNHVAMRSALDQAITASYAQQFPNAPTYAHNAQTGQAGPMGPMAGFPSPFPDPSVSSSSNPISPTSPHPYRHTPYPMPGMPGYRADAQRRSASISNEKGPRDQVTPKVEPSPTATGSGSRRSSMLPPKPSVADLEPTTGGGPSDPAPGFSPFTTSLPLDTQQLLGPALDPADPFTSSLMAGSAGAPMPKHEADFYNYAPKGLDMGFLEGMNSTLAPPPSASQEVLSAYHTQSAPDNNVPSGFQFAYDDLKGEPFFNLEDGSGSNAHTPGGEGAWSDFIYDSSWAEHGS